WYENFKTTGAVDEQEKVIDIHTTTYEKETGLLNFFGFKKIHRCHPYKMRLNAPLEKESLEERKNFARDSPISTKKIEAKWTRWSLCQKNDMNAQRHRYLKCTDKKDVRKCPKESVMCRHPPMLNIKKLASAFAEKIECLAIRDSNGQKRCPHGMRIRPDGKREYCGNPIDC
uniref:Uncharacterized protein n=1 Tax=Acrobeloides nanus TaxID=290746 RepID=A0A914EEV0_9BILA